MPTIVPDNARAPDTPDDVEIRMEAREPDVDPTLGITVPPKPEWSTTAPVNRLVTIGDSLTHGFQSGAIFNTRLSWPKIVAWEMGWDDFFRHPTYDAHGGLPLNIEYLVRDLEHRYGSSINLLELPLAAMRLRSLMARVEDYWERGPGAEPPVTSGIMHNLAVYGWDLRDALSRTDATLKASIKKPKDDLLKQIVENANERAARRVYASAYDQKRALTVFEAATKLGAEGARKQDGTIDTSADGIETLVVMLGANNALGAVTSLQVRWSGAGFDSLDGKAAYNVWRPSHFVQEFDEIARQLRNVRARHVIFGNVPHVTIAPIARGVARKVREGSRYFPYYTRPWISDGQFKAVDDPHLTETQARAVDSAIDQYNDHIATVVKQARQEGLDWYILDIAGMLDRLACRRYQDDISARPAWWYPYELPPELTALDPVPDSRFFRAGPSGRTAGGLFSLDGVHPTTVAYGLVAQEFINIMQRAGIKFYFGDRVTERTGPVRVDFMRLIAADTLVASPPASLDADLKLLGWLDDTVDWVGRVLPFHGSRTVGF
jgi:hypothetical protein